MKAIYAMTVAAACLGGVTAARAAGPVSVDGLAKVSGTNIDFYYDAAVYQSATVSGDELRLGLQLVPGGGVSTTRQVIAVAHSGLGLRGEVGTGLLGDFDLTPYTALHAHNGFDAYFANQVGGVLVWGDDQTQPLARVAQDYVWDPVGYHYQGDFSSSIFPQTLSNSRPDRVVGALLLNSELLLGLDNGHGPLDGSGATVRSVTYSFETVFPGTTPPVPEPGAYAMLLAGLALLATLARRRPSGAAASC